MRVTRIAATRTCAICERTLLMGERAIRFAPSEGEELVDVCPLCQEQAIEHGWIKEGTPTTPTVGGERRRRRRGLAAIFDLHRSGSDDTIAPPEPILRRLSDQELAIVEAIHIVDVFEIAPHASPPASDCPLAFGSTASRGERRASYFENRYDIPMVNPGLFSQADRDCLAEKIVDPSGAGW